MPRPKKVEEAVETQPQAVTGDTVEISESELLGIDMEGAIARLQKKYEKQYHIAWPHEEDVKMKHNYWQPLKTINGGTDVEPCKFEEADKRKAHLVLCWRKRELQDRIDNRLKQANIESYRREKSALSKGNLQQSVNNLGLSGVKISSDEIE